MTQWILVVSKLLRDVCLTKRKKCHGKDTRNKTAMETKKNQYVVYLQK